MPLQWIHSLRCITSGKRPLSKTIGLWPSMWWLLAICACGKATAATGLQKDCSKASIRQHGIIALTWKKQGKMDISACKAKQKLTLFQTSVTSILGLLHKQELTSSFGSVYAGSSTAGCIFCCLFVCAMSTITSVTATMALCVFPESTHSRLVLSLVWQQKISERVTFKL